MTNAHGAATTVAAPSPSPHEVGDRVTLAEHARRWRLVCEHLNDHDRGVVLLHAPAEEPDLHRRLARASHRVLWADGCRTWEWATDLVPADPPDTEE